MFDPIGPIRWEDDEHNNKDWTRVWPRDGMFQVAPHIYDGDEEEQPAEKKRSDVAKQEAA